MQIRLCFYRERSCCIADIDDCNNAFALHVAVGLLHGKQLRFEVGFAATKRIDKAVEAGLFGNAVFMVR